MSSIQSQSLVRSQEASSFKLWVSRHPILAYFVLAFLLTWTLELPMLLGKDGLGILAYHVPMPIYVILFLASSYAGPTRGAIYITSMIDGKDGVREFFRRYRLWRVEVRWYLFAFFALPLISLASASVFMGREVFSALAANWKIFFTAYLPAMLIFPAFITWGEEPGWRGFALTRMQEKYEPWLAALVVGFFHGLWHLPIFILVSGPAADGPFHLPRFLINVLGIMMLGVIWAWVFNNSKQSILMAVLLHASSNANQLFMLKLLPGIPKQSGQLTSIIYIVLAVVLLVATKGRLSYHRLETGK